MSKDIQDALKDYMQTINTRLLRGDAEHYDPVDKEYIVGIYYIHEGLNYFEFREVQDTKGGYRTIGKEFKTVEELTNFLDGFLVGHYDTCETLDVDIEEEEIDLDTIDLNDPELPEEERALYTKLKAQLDADRAAGTAEPKANN